MFEKAERLARKGIELEGGDPWTTHALAHVFEMTGRQDEGVAFMHSTVKEWSVSIV